ncbi:DUF4279 domain-containing protein [Streptomyces sp. NBC_00306]|uniref:DUF4279 domain-containing protein n=1 Tax=Streptomyces sp. NBC_00306 TaxID=2975708 RepID=UPI002E27F6C3|nr:DUF4279 domain-containing protein [Streptomyces sp. NBC_00306]
MNQQARPGESWTLTDVTLLIQKPDLDPEDVTRRLDIQPSAVRNPGVDRWGPPGETSGQWRLQCDERTTRTFSEQLHFILAAAEGRTSVLQSLNAEGCEISIVIGGYAANDSQLSLTAAELIRLARLDIPLTLTPSLSER